MDKNMEYVPFDPKELEPVAMLPGQFPWEPDTPVFNSPISRKENFYRFIRGEHPLWMPHIKEFKILGPGCNPDMWARGMTTADHPVDRKKFGGKDMFGVDWEYDAPSHGSMVRPGTPLVKDIEHWEDYVTFPDIEKWDWAQSAEENRAAREAGYITMMGVPSGLFERLISFVGMEDALVSLIDEDAQEAVHRLFDKLCVLYDGIFTKAAEYLKPDVIWFHDDWGSQRAPMFSVDTAREMLLPYVTRVAASAHRLGMVFQFHSCGMVEPMVPLMVEAGADMWNGQPMNDRRKLSQLYGDKLVSDTFPDAIPEDASPEAVAANVAKYLEDHKGLRTYVGMHHGMHPQEYRYVYELSRKQYNP